MVAAGVVTRARATGLLAADGMATFAAIGTGPARFDDGDVLFTDLASMALGFLRMLDVPRIEDSESDSDAAPCQPLAYRGIDHPSTVTRRASDHHAASEPIA